MYHRHRRHRHAGVSVMGDPLSLLVLMAMVIVVSYVRHSK